MTQVRRVPGNLLHAGGCGGGIGGGDAPSEHEHEDWHQSALHLMPVRIVHYSDPVKTIQFLDVIRSKELVPLLSAILCFFFTAFIQRSVWFFFRPNFARSTDD